MRSIGRGRSKPSSYTYDTEWLDKLTSYNDQSITYDLIGNPVSYLGHNLEWSFGRQLASFGDISYTYNEEGIRTKKINGEVVTEYYLDGNKIIEQSDGTNTIHFLYDSRGEITGFVYNENTYHYVKNVQSDITAILNSSGEIVSEYKYDPYGKIISISGDTVIGQLNPFRYRSYYYDTDTELYYLQTRYYDPEVGRFINCDDFSYIESQEEGLAWNVFSYCENNPVNGNDKDGHGLLDILSLFKKVVPAVKVIKSLYELITIKYDNLDLIDEKGHVEDEDRTNSTKGIISIDFTRKTDLWYQGFKQGRSFADEITRIALEKFRNTEAIPAKKGKEYNNKSFNRCFLLSESCVSNEIYLHLQGYLWAKEYKGVLPVAMFIGHYYLNKKEKDNHYKKEHQKTGVSLLKLYVADASKEADIYEADAALRKYVEGNFFYYFEGIADCYKGTKYDPFCANTKIDLRLRYYTREGWQNEKLKCSCK